MRHLILLALIGQTFLFHVYTSHYANAELRAAETGALKPTYLRCEYRVDPLGIEERAPRLSWLVLSSVQGQRQTAYRVLVASDPEKLQADRGDLWDLRPRVKFKIYCVWFALRTKK